MRLASLLPFTALAAFLCLAAYATPAQDQSTDVAAAARKAKEQQKNAPKPKKVLTNDDFPSSSTSSSSSAAATGKTEGQGDAGQVKDTSAENDPKSEAYWRKKYKAVHDKLTQAEAELDVLQRELDKDQVQYYSDPQKALMEQYSRSDINEKTAKIEAKKKEIESLKQQLSDMEDDVRKAGGDPGWLR